MDPTTLPDVLDVKDAATLLRVSPRAVRRLASFKRIPHQKVGRRALRFSRAALEAWLQSGGR